MLVTSDHVPLNELAQRSQKEKRDKGKRRGRRRLEAVGLVIIHQPLYTPQESCHVCMVSMYGIVCIV